MSVDTVNFALTAVRCRMQQRVDCYSSEGKSKLLNICESLRWDLMRGDPAGFDRTFDHYLAKEVDAMDHLAEELFEELRINDREELTAILDAE